MSSLLTHNQPEPHPHPHLHKTKIPLMANIQKRNTALLLLTILALYLLPTCWAHSWTCVTIDIIIVCTLARILVSPSIHLMPPNRHKVISLDISGSTKSFRMVRTDADTYIPAIFTPKTERKIVRETRNRTAQKKENGSFHMNWELENADKITNTGDYHVAIIDEKEYNYCQAIAIWLLMLARADRDSIYNTNETRKYLRAVQQKIKLLTGCVRLCTVLAAAIQLRETINNSSPTLPRGAEVAKSPVIGLIEDEKTITVNEKTTK